MNDKVRNNKIALISLFLALEVMLFIALDFAGASTLLKVLAIILAGALVPVFLNEIKSDLSEGLYLLIMPLLIYGVVTILAPAYITYPGGSSDHNTFVGYSLFSRIINGISLVALLLLGYFMRKSKVFTSKYVYITIIGAFALPVLISLFATLINYGFFHTLLYKGYVNFYQGVAYRVDNQASYLVGFKIMTVDINVLTNNALFILSAGLGLLFFKPTEDKFTFVTLALVSTVGFLAIALTGSFRLLLFLLPAVIFSVIVKFNLFAKINKKRFMYILYVIFGTGLTIFLLNTFDVFNISNLWLRSRLFSKLFYNGRMLRFYEAFRYSFSEGNFLGQYANWGYTVRVFPTGSFIFDVLWLDGIIGFIALGAFLFLLIKALVNHFSSSDDALGFKVMLGAFLLTVFARYVIAYPFYHYTFDEFRSIDSFPLISAPIFLLIVFLTGYVFKVKDKVEVNDEEN